MDHISCYCKCKFNSTTCNSNQKWKNKTCQCECKNYCKSKKNYSRNPCTRTCDNSKYLKSVVDTSVITFDETITLMDIVSTKKANAIVINISINCHSEKKRDFYILHTVLLTTILLLRIAIICYHYGKHRSKQKDIDALTMYKWKIINFKKFLLKIVRVIIPIT